MAFLRFVSSNILTGGDIIYNQVDMEKKIEEFAVAAVDNDVVVIRAPHLYGKTTMVKLICYLFEINFMMY